MKDCPLVVYGKKTTNDAKQGGLKLGLASYLPQKWWCQAPENISCQITGYFFLLQYPQWQMAWCFCLVKIFCLLLTLCTFLKVPNEIKSIYIQLKGASHVVPLVLQWNKQINLFNVLVGVHRRCQWRILWHLLRKKCCHRWLALVLWLAWLTYGHQLIWQCSWSRS